MKALSRPLQGPQLKSDLAEGCKRGIQGTELLAFLFTTSETHAKEGLGQNYYYFQALACWLAVLHMAALRSIASTFSLVYLLPLVSGFVAETGVRIAIILSYGAWAFILTLGVTTASALQGLLHV